MALSCLLMFFAGSVSEAVHAQDDCVIEETVTLGSSRGPRSETFDNMSSITEVELLDTSHGYWCPARRYWFNDNRLSTAEDCRGEFLVTGVQADCTPAVEPADNAIAQTPLFLSAQAEPNVMFVLDDSGSMRFELMPDELTTESGVYSTYYLFPRADGVYGSSQEYNNYVVTVDNDDVYNARARSPQINTIYYDPSVTYKPWVKHDGSHYPNASATCALHNPEREGTSAAYCRNLTVDNGNYNSNCWITGNGNSSHCNSRTFWPATYFWFNGGDAHLRSSFTRVQIRSSTATYTGHGREERVEDCVDAAHATCTYDEEMQNFANWYTYYRSRILAARAGIGLAFSQQGSGMRVGFGAINKGRTEVDGVDTRVVIDGVRRFAGTDRESFFESLYTHAIPAAGTPLRTALDAAGQYFMRTDNRGPWGETPGTNSSTPQLPCRRCYTVLMTDGYWSAEYNGSSAAADNNDGEDGSAITNHRPEGGSYTYEAKSPFSDRRDGTLADVAMYYWKNDLRAGNSGLDNVVGPTDGDPAFWQHMSTYGVGLGLTGSVDPDAAFAAIATGADITWPNPDTSNSGNCSGSSCPARLDDLLHAGVNSRGGFFSAADPNAFASELSRVLQNIAVENRSSSSSIAANSTRLDEGTYIYQASFNGLDWSGQIRAFHPDPETGAVDEDAPTWDTDDDGVFASPDTRTIFTASGVHGTLINGVGAGVNFTWGELSAAQQALLQPEDGLGAERVAWLRGSDADEGEEFREREHLLGDIINSDPFFVGDVEDFGYRVLPETEGSAYATFLTSGVAAGGKSNRTNMLYVGANDGMLHGFNALTGAEVFGYIPAGVFANLHELTSPEYNHRYFVDGSPRAGDAYIGGAWKTVLVAGTGAGGRSVFALDVTNPDSVGPASLLWEFSTDADDAHKLGVAMSQPSIARVDAGDQWVAIFGNGYESGDNVKLLVVNLADGTIVRAIDTGVSGIDNGLGSPVPVDVDKDRVTDYVYAGDLKGNLWRFDLTGNNANSWSVSKLFAAVDDAGQPQPITTRPAVGPHPDGGVMVYVGTGKYFQAADNQLADDPQVQSFYGIRDVDGALVERDDLVEQTIIYEGDGGQNATFGVRAVSNNSADSAPVAGWYLDLLPGPPRSPVAEGERAVSTPLLRFGRIIFTTIIPNEDPCGHGGESWLMELDAINGGRLPYSALDVNNDGEIDSDDYVEVNGERIPVSGKHSKEMIKTPGVVGAGEIEYKYTSGSSGTIGVTREKGAGDVLGRQSWRQMQ